MIKTIISDLGGVVLNRGIWIFWDYLEKEFNIPFEKSKVSFLKYYKLYFSGEISEELFWTNYLKDLNLKRDWRELRTILLTSFKPNECVINFYRELREKGYELVLLSDQTKEWWPFLDKTFGISKHFDTTIVSALVGLYKPNQDIYELALTKSKSIAEECVFIDDLEKNLVPAKEMGMKTILFKDCKELKEKLNTLRI
jgi:putative hydrolase of the HAD superfamily